MRYLVDTAIINNTTGKMTLKAFTFTAADEHDAIMKALESKGGNETMIVKKTHSISDFSH